MRRGDPVPRAFQAPVDVHASVDGQVYMFRRGQQNDSAGSSEEEEFNVMELRPRGRQELEQDRRGSLMLLKREVLDGDNLNKLALQYGCKAQLEAQRATGEFQKAVEILRAAKETIALAEERLLEEDSRQFDSAWQEMLNHATNRVMEAETARTRSELEHRKTANHYNACISHMRQLEKKLKRTINKSRPYFELKAKYYLQLEQLRQHVDEFQAKLTVAKADYRTVLRNLETISEEIHARRHSITMGTRGRGVGAEGVGGNEDITNFKMESDGLSMASVTAMEGPSPGGWLSPESRCGSGHDSPLLGPRSQCSGASSPDPDCDQERGDRAEGAEQKLEAGLSKLTLTIIHPLHPGNDDPKDDPKTTSSFAPTTYIPTPTILLTNSA
ncbi:hypothetical protein J4Q44_G00033700 [Coregonus suidteri]|uniref:SH3 domain-binding protein 5 n=1 Tax=Coregonus suidteri TaxID=861788 RepID=A0AAN8R9C9_9TELE